MQLKVIRFRGVTYAPPKSCIPRRAKMRMKRNKRNNREMIERILLNREMTRFRREDQYLKIATSKTSDANNWHTFEWGKMLFLWGRHKLVKWQWHTWVIRTVAALYDSMPPPRLMFSSAFVVITPRCCDDVICWKTSSCGDSRSISLRAIETVKGRSNVNQPIALNQANYTTLKVLCLTFVSTSCFTA